MRRRLELLLVLLQWRGSLDRVQAGLNNREGRRTECGVEYGRRDCFGVSVCMSAQVVH